MTSRRRQPGDRSRQACEDGDRGERKTPKQRTGGYDRETPQKAHKRLSRTSRSGQTSSPVPPRSDREDELSSNKKTPRQFSRCKPWMSAINSPSNDGDQQQDIFWDPHSPTTFKLENGKKKLSANKCKFDISDIVNRIAPKGEKPSSSDAAYLGIWIGEDAIPCTPVVARTRNKMPRSRILQTEEELMKLAKQLDSNLVKQKDQTEELLVFSEDEMFSERNATKNEDDSFLDDLPEEDYILDVKSVSQRPQKSSQRSVDQDAEAAFNALFDSSTQKYSGHLSQGLSDVSTSSTTDAPGNVKSNVQEDIGHSKKEQCSENKRSKQSSLASVLPTNTFQGVSKCSEQNNGKETVQSVSSSQDDFEDDWGNDLLEDDSFIMQVTQNPELIATPKNSMPPNKPGHTKAQHAGGDVKSAAISSSYSKMNNFKFVPRKVNCESEAKPSNLSSTKMTGVNTFKGNSRDTDNAKAFSSTSTQGPSKPQAKAVDQMAKNNVHNLIPATNSTLMKSSQKPCAQAVPQTRAATVNKDSIQHDEWDDLKFSDEVLDMFCESDSLWEGKEDDDDLLYQVCDDVERLTQAQETDEKNPKKETPRLSTSTYTSQSNRNGSHFAASSSFGCHKLNNRGVSPASFSGNRSNASQNSSVQKSNQTFSRSVSAPSAGECKNTIHLGSAHSLLPAKSLAATCSVKNPLAPTKYSFTKIKPSQVTSVHTAQTVAGNCSGYNGHNPQSFDDSRNNRDTLVQCNSDSISKLQQPSLKRHLSESTIQSSKGMGKKKESAKDTLHYIL